MELSDKEKNLIKIILERTRKTPYGEIHSIIHMQNGQPERIEIEKDKESVKL